ncbi:hypothetical protein AST01_02425 [Staphylococcus equorum]|uniref:primase alpha helix C-terminal domain-containing protein n=1 Tax=Staphylococcus equorum TaxID=246432 RepID=UPI000853BD68|nr:primase alpha helix C-terminal domain-containing protein [Staphylococcus equorum]OEK71088.1 hypothetical protein AST01_02425 [Staphylococcus equorum]
MKKIEFDNDNLIIFQYYQNLKADSHVTQMALTFNQLCDWLSEYSISETNKYKAGLYLFANMNNFYRKNDNVIDRTALVLDFDDLLNEQDILTKFKDTFNFSYIVHSSYNHTVEKPRIRLIIPLDKPLQIRLYDKSIQLIERALQVKCDSSSYTVSQAQAKGVKKMNDSPIIFDYQETYFIETDKLINTLEHSKKEENKSNEHKQKRSNDYWLSIAMGVDEGNRNATLTSLLGLLFRKNLPDEIIYGLAYSWAKQCSPPIEDKEIDKTYKSIFKRHYNV